MRSADGSDTKDTLVRVLLDALSKNATRWTIACGVGWAMAMIGRAVVVRSWADGLSNLGYLFLILGVAGIRRSIVTTAAAATIDRAKLVNQVTPEDAPVVAPSSIDPVVDREIVKQLRDDEKRLTQ